MATYNFTDLDIDDYQDSEEFITWACTLALDDPAFDCVSAHRAFRPVRN
jgi:hypothetical protein